MFLSFVILPLELDVYKGDSYFCVYYLNVKFCCYLYHWHVATYHVIACVYVFHVAMYHVTTCVYVSRDYLCLCVT